LQVERPLQLRRPVRLPKPQAKTRQPRWWLQPAILLCIAFWLMLWAGYNTGPWYVQNRRFPTNDMELFHGLRAFVPILAGWVAIILILIRGRVALRVVSGSLGLAVMYGVVGLASSAVVSIEAFTSVYWALAYTSVALVLVALMSLPDRVSKIYSVLQLNWVIDVAITLGLLGAIPFLGRSAVLAPTKGSPLGFRAYANPVEVLGMESSRNTGFARYAAIAGLAALAKIWEGKLRWRFLWAIILGVSLYALVLSQGRTEVLAFVAAATLILLLQRAKRIFIIAAAIVGAILLGMFGVYGDFWKYVTRQQRFDVTFTGRTQIWDLGWNLFTKSPWWGFGFQSDRIYLNGEHMHNVVMQGLVQSGIFGTIPLLIALGIVWLLVLKLYVVPATRSRMRLATEVPGVLLFLTISSMMESTFAYFSAAWIIGAPLLAYLEAVNWREKKLRAKAAAKTPAYAARARLAHSRPLAIHNKQLE
jgi:O-antigen ligase